MKRLLAAIAAATAVVFLTTISVPASAGTLRRAPLAATSGPPATCAAAPSTAEATVANRDRFVALWTPRVANKAFIQQFADQTTIPADIAAEGFHVMAPATQAWLVACLVDHLLSMSGQAATADQVANYQVGLDLIIFAKAQIAMARQQLASTSAPAVAPPASGPTNLTSSALQGMAAKLASAGSLTAAGQPAAHATTPAVATSSDFHAQASAHLKALVAAGPITPTTTSASAGVSGSVSATVTLDPNALLASLGQLLNTPLIALILKAVADLEQLIAKIQQVLFTVPGVNVLGGAFYRVCAESATQPLACSVSLPVGVPIPVDVNGDNVPDVLATLTPSVNLSNLTDVGVSFAVSRLPLSSGALPAHVFAVYDPPIINKRIEFGYDGRASTLADSSTTTFTLHNAYAALAGDVSVSAQVQNTNPGTTEAVTFAVKSLIGGALLVPPGEADPVAGAVQFSPFPTTLKVDGHLLHRTQDEDIFTVQSATPSAVNAVIDQDTTTTTPKSHREFTAAVDKLPTSVTVDLVHNGVTGQVLRLPAPRIFSRAGRRVGARGRC